MIVAILNIGDELLIGQVANTNASRMAQMLTEAGIGVGGTYVVGDNEADIRRGLSLCLDSSDAVLVTGGLGPTKDDVTKKCLCDFFNSELYENKEALLNVERLFAERGYEVTPVNRRQAWVPRCCSVIVNLLGTAPGMWFEYEGKVVVALPGVPFEIEHLMETEVVPRLQRHFAVGQIVTKNVLVHGIGESFLSDMIAPWEDALPKHIHVAYLPQPGLVKLRLTALGGGCDRPSLEQQLDDAVRDLDGLAGKYVVGVGAETLPELVADVFMRGGFTLATAESCTGGLLAAQLTAMAGASDYYRGGVTAYCNDAKERLLGVRHATLEAYGAVSSETVAEMACGVRERFASDYAVATTGVAGPAGGTPSAPVGTVWVGIAGPQGRVETRRLQLHGRRAQVIERATQSVWAELVRMVKTNCQE